MIGYVNRINKATLNVTIGGIRIGTAKYSRLAQINLHSRIITFSRFAIENVPERGRRYLVIHELAHVKEANHTKRFWELVGLHEPDFRRIGHSLDIAFKKNVRSYQQEVGNLARRDPGLQLNESSLLSSRKLLTYKSSPQLPELAGFQNSVGPAEQSSEETFECMEADFDMWGGGEEFGAIHGGSEFDNDTTSGGDEYCRARSNSL